MKKVLKWIGIVFVGLIVLGMIIDPPQSQEHKTQATAHDNQSANQAGTNTEQGKQETVTLSGPQKNAVRSAKQYLSMQGFSCKGLIQQLSSSAGDKYTVSQATYGAQQAGASTSPRI
ncbi:Ltp family lipoprotein [Tepidicella xavieri]|uniref:Ltp family lipoprotein n=1 Tax=Tepidicella xavieri TaxID=360241 RepID=UPI0010614472|nr:Ltp family lipoprotein [Tepidicella xavieri]